MFKSSFADLDNVGEIFPNGAQQFLTSKTFTLIKAIERILIVSSLLVQCAEGLGYPLESGQGNPKISYRRELTKPVLATFIQSAHPRWLLRP